jgi:D-alanyl-lipoteichoic acid acyltransferase DltB (MBOAT superfamily)
MAFIPSYILILATTIIVDYFAGIYIEGATGKRKKLFLILSIISNVGFLMFFKYFNFLNGNLAALAGFLDWNYPINALNIILPIGLSFHTFQAMSYTIEVFRGRQKAERHFGIFALYVLFYPQLVAGPIERPQNLLPQFSEKKYFNYERVVSGLRIMLVGFFKKIVIADNLARIVNTVYGNPYEYNGFSLAIATFFFAFQIYYDFSGYSDIAIGAARVMGFKLMKNFDNPYRSQSIGEFWKRWHISLSSWFKDYVYIPLGGNKVAASRWYINIFIVFLISGFWHGANWTYIVWGGLHGFYLIFSRFTLKIRLAITHALKISSFPKVHKAIKTLIVFILVSIGWIFFRASSLDDAFYILRTILSDLTPELKIARFDVAAYSAFIFALEISLFILGLNKIRSLLNKKVFRWSVYLMAIFIILFFGAFKNNQFIYFQF